VPDEPGLPVGAGEQRELLARLWAMVEARDAENTMPRAELAAEPELRRRLELASRSWSGAWGWTAATPGRRARKSRSQSAR
jgi:hypothetical protein